MKADNLEEKGHYNRVARQYDATVWPLERLVHRRLRRRLFQHIPVGADFLEAGVGTGLNFPFYPAAAKGTASDLSPRMLDLARNRAERLGLDVTLRRADVRSLPFADDSFDYVVATLLFCDVPEPLKGLSELRRVCRRDGRVLLLEHVRPRNKLLGKLVDLIDPVLFSVFGIHLNRRTVETVRAAGLETCSVHSFFGIYRIIVSRPGTRPPEDPT